MGFRRHHVETEEETETPMQKQIREDLKEFAVNLQKEINQNGGQFPEAKKKYVRPNNKGPKKITGEVKKEVIETKEKLHEKYKQSNIGIVGSSVDVKDFRAICKKKGMYINVVLAKMIHDWNKANYNL